MGQTKKQCANTRLNSLDVKPKWQPTQYTKTRDSQLCVAWNQGEYAPME